MVYAPLTLRQWLSRVEDQATRLHPHHVHSRYMAILLAVLRVSGVSELDAVDSVSYVFLLPVRFRLLSMSES